ncbi:hypothetical protein FN846DRAFT_911218 [Sphaerosporella brunnea]|uniref:Protein kinase domain-containing protein n=1 Tax=Sphaerosporella brunnea TaxID=1250544 RepID=A0A5J5EL27_9PEZI|nr:hypothetical protein FN846DRAFT_911218 [Sphaerosporella brunnea]
MPTAVTNDPEKLEQQVDRLYNEFAALLPDWIAKADKQRQQILRTFFAAISEPGRSAQKELHKTQTELETANDRLRETQIELNTAQDGLRKEQTYVKALLKKLRAARTELLGLRPQIQANEQLVKSMQQTIDSEKQISSILKDNCETLRVISRRQEMELIQNRNELMGRQDNLSSLISRTKTQTWHDAVDKGWIRAREEPLPVGGRCDDARAIANKVFTTEKAMYKPVVKMLKAALPNCAVFDTHSSGDNASLKPDITITTKQVNMVHALYVRTITEIKKGKILVRDKAQVINYLCQIAESQYWRRQFTGLVTNTEQSYFLQLRRTNGMFHRFEVQTYAPVSFEESVAYLRDVVANSPAETPCTPPFNPALGKIQSQRGMTQRSVVAEFKLPRPSDAVGWVDGVTIPPGCKTVCVKRAYCADETMYPVRACEDEINILKKVHALGGHQSIVSILFHDDEMLEFGMLPCALPADPKTLNANPPLASSILNDVFCGMTWLHKHDIIHRDIRWDNIVRAGAQGVIIDFGAAVDLAELAGGTTTYAGGYLCCPPRLLNALDQPYHPTVADDYHAYVLLVNTLLMPGTIVGFESGKVESPLSSETCMLQDMWMRLRENEIWRPWVVAAEAEDADTLGRLNMIFDGLTSVSNPVRREGGNSDGEQVGEEAAGEGDDNEWDDEDDYGDDDESDDELDDMLEGLDLGA